MNELERKKSEFKYICIFYSLFALIVIIFSLANNNDVYDSNNPDDYRLEGVYQFEYYEVIEHKMGGTARRSVNYDVYYPNYIGYIHFLDNYYDKTDIYFDTYELAEEYGKNNTILNVSLYVSRNEEKSKVDIILLNEDESIDYFLEMRNADDIFHKILVGIFIVITIPFTIYVIKRIKKKEIN